MNADGCRAYLAGCSDGTLLEFVMLRGLALWRSTVPVPLLVKTPDELTRRLVVGVSGCAGGRRSPRPCRRPLRFESVRSPSCFRVRLFVETVQRCLREAGGAA